MENICHIKLTQISFNNCFKSQISIQIWIKIILIILILWCHQYDVSLYCSSGPFLGFQSCKSWNSSEYCLSAPMWYYSKEKLCVWLRACYHSSQSNWRGSFLLQSGACVNVLIWIEHLSVQHKFNTIGKHEI